MISVDFVKTRALATRSTQATIASAWTWSKKTLNQWDLDIAAINQLMAAESDARVAWRNCAELWQSAVDKIQNITRMFASVGALEFSNNPIAVTHFESLRTDGRNRADIYAQGLAAKSVWTLVAPTWVIDNENQITLSSLTELLAACIFHQTAESPALTAWRDASVKLNNKAETLDRENVAWYAEATRRFAEGTNEGDLIRRNIPTTGRPEVPVEKAVISNLMASGGDIHWDCEAEGATRFTYLQQTPGSSAFVVILADTPLTHVTLQGQAPGLHRIKAFGNNSRGQGPDSDVVEITVAASAAA